MNLRRAGRGAPTTVERLTKAEREIYSMINNKVSLTEHEKVRQDAISVVNGMYGITIYCACNALYFLLMDQDDELHHAVDIKEEEIEPVPSGI